MECFLEIQTPIKLFALRKTSNNDWHRFSPLNSVKISVIRINQERFFGRNQNARRKLNFFYQNMTRTRKASIFRNGIGTGNGI